MLTQKLYALFYCYFVWTKAHLLKTLDGIFIAAIKDTDIIASTVRVFDREIYVQKFGGNGHCIVRCGGIGEVSTKAQYRGNRLASTLLQVCINYYNKL